MYMVDWVVLLHMQPTLGGIYCGVFDVDTRVPQLEDYNTTTEHFEGYVHNILFQ